MKRKVALIAVLVLATVVATIVFSRFCWFKQNEHVALWLEGIALVLIFAWDRIDAQDAHKETLAQIQIAKEQAEAAKFTAESIKNSERAWLSGSLLWSERAQILFTDDGHGNNQRTQAILRFKLKNDGRTPAWVESVVSRMDIPGRETSEVSDVFTIHLDPLAAGAGQEVTLSLACAGKPKMMKSEMLRVRITVNYRDIFEAKVMPLEYSINPLTHQIHRVENVSIPNISIP
jgi:hypothetical protein